ncbi:MAG TPA: hypothetical protein VGK62_00800 [Gaiellaceae bacterium]
MRSVKRRYLAAVGAVVAAGVALALALSHRLGRRCSRDLPDGVREEVGSRRAQVERPAERSSAGGRREGRSESRQQAVDGRKVLEYHYVHCVDAPGVDEDCWAVSLDPSGLTGNGGRPGIAPQEASDLMVLIYPMGDEVIETQQGA